MMMKAKAHKKFFIGAIVLMLLASLSIFVGALFKIMHWPHGSALLLYGMIGEFVAIVLVGVGLWKYNNYRKSQIQ